MINKCIFNIAILLLGIVAFSACSDNDSNGGGTPVIRYIRPCDVDLSDSLLVSAYLGERIAVIGENLSSVKEIYFNDQKAKLNPNFITNNAIIVTIPTEIPESKQDLIFFKTSNTTVEFAFETKVPDPVISTMTCEYVAAGETAYIQGYYFVDEEGSPLVVEFPGGVEGTVVSHDYNNIEVIVPEGAQTGPIKVTSIYGTGESGLHFRDERNIILDFDTLFPDGGYAHGWHSGYGVSDEGGINGQYLIFSGKDDTPQPWMTDNTWDDSNYGYERWTYNQSDPDFFDASDLTKYVLKFEVNIPEVWSTAAMQIVFTGADEAWMNWQSEPATGGNANNAYMSDSSYPRALWIPWVDTDDAAYTTDGWITVTIPMSDFKYNGSGATVTVNPPGHYSGITLFVGQGGVSGTDCNPVFYIDNVRVVEAN